MFSFAKVSDDYGVVGPRTHYKLRKIRCLIECDRSGSYLLVASRHTFELEWRESDGPIVATPVHRGFGTRLLSGALEPFGGTIETTFEPTGLICRLSATLPEKNATSAGSDVTLTNRSAEFTSQSGLGRVKTLCRRNSGCGGLRSSFFSGFDYAGIAAIRGWMPMMFITRVRL